MWVGVIVFNLPHRDARARFAVVLGSEGLVDLSLEGGGGGEHLARGVDVNPRRFGEGVFNLFAGCVAQLDVHDG